MTTVIRILLAAAVCLCTAGFAQGSAARFCQGDADDVCYSVAVPSASARTNTGNIYFQISAPMTFSWVALGTGSEMAGSNMFIMYADGTGNVTISPRLGTGHVKPVLDTSSTAAKLTLLAGSGVSADGNTMTANVACSNCESWAGGADSLSLTNKASNWIAAWRTGDPLDSPDPAEVIHGHDGTAIVDIDLTKATISSDSNPFTTAAGESGSGNGNSNGVTVIQGNRPNMIVLAAHGIVMALVMVVLYPLGSALMPLLGIWWVHATWQLTAFALMWAGFALGVIYAQDANELFNQTHTTFGMAIVALITVQPLLGWWHHVNFKRLRHRTVVSHLHIWYGRSLLVLGAVNGGLGLQLASASQSQIIAYSVVTAAVVVIWGVAKLFATLRKRRAERRARTGGDEQGGAAAGGDIYGVPETQFRPSARADEPPCPVSLDLVQAQSHAQSNKNSSSSPSPPTSRRYYIDDRGEVFPM